MPNGKCFAIRPIIGWYIYELRKSEASVQISDTSVLDAQPKNFADLLQTDGFFDVFQLVQKDF